MSSCEKQSEFLHSNANLIRDNIKSRDENMSAADTSHPKPVDKIFVKTILLPKYPPIPPQASHANTLSTEKICPTAEAIPQSSSTSTLVELGEKELKEFNDTAFVQTSIATDGDHHDSVYIAVKEERHDDNSNADSCSEILLETDAARERDDEDNIETDNDTGTNAQSVSNFRVSVLSTLSRKVEARKRKEKSSSKEGEPTGKVSRKMKQAVIMKYSKKFIPKAKRKRGRPRKQPEIYFESDDVTQDFDDDDDVADVIYPGHQSQVVAPYTGWLSPPKMKEMFDSVCKICYSVHLVDTEAVCPLVDESKITIVDNFPESLLGFECPRELVMGYSRVYEDRLSLFACQKIAALTRFGPLKGRRVLQDELAKICIPDIDLDHFWPVRRTEIPFDDLVIDEYIETVDSQLSNYLRFLVPESSEALWAEEGSAFKANVQRVLLEDNEIYFVTTRDIEQGEELFLRSMEPPEQIYFNLGCMAAAGPTHLKKIETLLRECTMCGGKLPEKFPFPGIQRLVRHRRMMHTSLPAMCDFAGIYQCNFCGDQFSGGMALRKHRINEHLTPHGMEGNVQCQYCKTYKKSMDNLTNHIASVHFVSESHPITCSRCGLVFTSYAKYSRHRTDAHAQVNEGRENKCGICGKEFGTYAAVQRHIRKVHEKKDYRVCETCGKSFKDHYQLKVHSLTHSGLKPFQCDMKGCSAAFTTKQWLQKHYRGSHGFTDTNMPSIARKVDFSGEEKVGTSAQQNSSFISSIFHESEEAKLTIDSKDGGTIFSSPNRGGIVSTHDQSGQSNVLNVTADSYATTPPKSSPTNTHQRKNTTTKGPNHSNSDVGALLNLSVAQSQPAFAVSPNPKIGAKSHQNPQISLTSQTHAHLTQSQPHYIAESLTSDAYQATSNHQLYTYEETGQTPVRYVMKQSTDGQLVSMDTASGKYGVADQRPIGTIKTPLVTSANLEYLSFNQAAHE